MQVPYRRADRTQPPRIDPQMTAEKFRELEKKLKKLKTVSRPRESAEVKRLALMGDFSENAGYQLAKSRLRGINYRILEIEDLLKRAEIISANPARDTVQIGHSVTIENNGQVKTYKILGSVETNPGTGIISRNSPLGSALLNKRIGDSVTISLTARTVKYKIIKID